MKWLWGKVWGGGAGSDETILYFIHNIGYMMTHVSLLRKLYNERSMLVYANHT